MNKQTALLINPPYHRRHGGGIIPPIGLSSLAASLRAVGCDPLIIDLAAEFPDYNFQHTEGPVERVASYLQKVYQKTPLLIGVGPLVTATLRSTHDIINTCREITNSKIVVGGPLCSVPGFSTVAGSYLDVDWYVAGDGETPITLIWNSLISGISFNSGYKGIGIANGNEPRPYRLQNLDKLPIPAHDLLSDYHYYASSRRTINSLRVTSVYLSRGCPYSCSFCAAPLSSGKVVRRFSPLRISEEISACFKAGYQNIIFYDDCLFVKSPKLEEEVLEFTRSIERSNWRGVFQLEFRCDAVVSLSDRAIISLYDAGCRQINMGIEKANFANLYKLRKQLSPEVAREACERINYTGIRTAGTFILGGPNETKEDIDATIEFASSLPLDFAQFNPLALYPGTSLFSQEYTNLTPGSWLDLCLNEEIAPMGDILWKSPDLPIEYILYSVLKAYRHFYSKERLQRVLNKYNSTEWQLIIESYRLLCEERAQSWIEKRASSLEKLNDGDKTYD